MHLGFQTSSHFPTSVIKGSRSSENSHILFSAQGQRNAQHTVYVWQLLITMGCKDARKRHLSLQDLLFATSNFMLLSPILDCGGCFRELKSITQPNCLALGCFLVILNNKSQRIGHAPFWNKAPHLLFFSSLPPPLVTHWLLPNNSALTLQRIT